MGLSLWRLGEHERAADAFRIALKQAPGLAVAHDALAETLRRDNSKIGEAALHAARAALLREQTKKRRAEPAPARAEITPVSGLADFERAARDAPRDRSQVVIVVSGLPRSGTSMMMRMLEAGGLEGRLACPGGEQHCCRGKSVRGGGKPSLLTT